jgi:hypothetical protein
MGNEDGELFRDPPIRVLLANLPELLAQIIGQTIEQQSDMRLIGRARNNWELLHLADVEIDVIILGAAIIYPPPGICSHLFAELPGVKILVIDPSGTAAMRYWVAVRHAKTTLTTSRRLITTIRDLANLDSAV